MSMTPPVPGYKKRKKSLSRRVRHRFKDFWRKYWSLIFAILLGLCTAFYFMPSLIRFFSAEDWPDNESCLSKITFSPQSRRGHREIVFCLSGDADKQKGFCSTIRRLAIGSIAIKGFDLIPEGTEFLLQSSSPDWNRENLPQRSPRLCAETWFRKSRKGSRSITSYWLRNHLAEIGGLNLSQTGL